MLQRLTSHYYLEISGFPFILTIRVGYIVFTHTVFSVLLLVYTSLAQNNFVCGDGVI